MPTVLFYNMDAERARPWKMLAMRLKLRIQDVSQAEFGETLAVLTGRAERTGAEPPEPFSEEMLVFADLTNGQLDKYLTEARRQRIPPVQLKAALTPTNAQWTSVELYQQIRAEHEAMAQKRREREGTRPK